MAQPGGHQRGWLPPGGAERVPSGTFPSPTPPGEVLPTLVLRGGWGCCWGSCLAGTNEHGFYLGGGGGVRSSFPAPGRSPFGAFSPFFLRGGRVSPSVGWSGCAAEPWLPVGAGYRSARKLCSGDPCLMLLSQGGGQIRSPPSGHAAGTLLGGRQRGWCGG